MLGDTYNDRIITNQNTIHRPPMNPMESPRRSHPATHDQGTRLPSNLTHRPSPRTHVGSLFVPSGRAVLNADVVDVSAMGLLSLSLGNKQKKNLDL